jgi:hypothetical protein
MPTLTSRSLPDLKQIADKTVWPAVSFDEEKLDRLLKESASFDEMAEDLKSELDRLTSSHPD